MHLPSMDLLSCHRQSSSDLQLSNLPHTLPWHKICSKDESPIAWVPTPPYLQIIIPNKVKYGQSIRFPAAFFCSLASSRHFSPLHHEPTQKDEKTNHQSGRPPINIGDHQEARVYYLKAVSELKGSIIIFFSGRSYCF